MKFSVSSSELLNGLMSVSKVIVPKPTNSILENFLFQLQGNTLTVTVDNQSRENVYVAAVTFNGEPLTELTIPEGVTQIGDHAFDGASADLEVFGASGSAAILSTYLSAFSASKCGMSAPLSSR